MIERRSFIKGLLLGAPVAGQALIQLATPAESALLRRGEETLIGQVGPLDRPERAPMMAMGADLYIKHPETGDYYRLGVVTELEVERSVVDITMAHDEYPRQMPGLMRLSGRFRG